MFYRLILYSIVFYTTSYAIVTDIARFESKEKAPIVLCGDFHSCDELSPKLVSIAKTQAQCIPVLFADYEIYAELPTCKDNNVLGRLKKNNICFDIENRGPVLSALRVLSMKRLNLPLDNMHYNSIQSIYDHYENIMYPLKEKYNQESELAKLFVQSFEVVHKEHKMLKQVMLEHNFHAADNLVSLYECDKPGQFIELVHNVWCKIFDLNALHIAYTQSKSKQLVMCTGNRHNTVLNRWLKNLDEYKEVYKNSIPYESEHESSIVQAALTEVECKKAVRILPFNTWGTVLGYAQLYSYNYCPTF